MSVRVYAIMPEIRIAIVCFDFPPNAGIGGRRWAKFAKGLIQAGLTSVDIIKAEPAKQFDQSGWTSDTKDTKLQIHSIPRKYPRIISHGPKNLVEKLIYRLHKMKLDLTEKGTIYDRSIGWQPSLLGLLGKIHHQQAITHLIATGAPFNVLYYCAQFKAQHHNITFLVDYRDPWIEAKNYGMTDISDARKREEIRKESFVLQQADIVTTPLPSFTKLLKRKNKHRASCTFYDLEHFFDPDDLGLYKAADQTNSGDALSIVYAGALYMGIEKYLKLLPDALSRLPAEQKQKFEFLFFSPDKNPACFEGTPLSGSVKPPIGKRVYHHLKRANAIILLLPDHMPDSRTTKFYEVLAFQKPILYLGPKGEIASFIESQNLGVAASRSEEIVDFLVRLSQGNLHLNSVDIKKHSLRNRTAELISLFGFSI